jgi:hypothetical protein
MPYTDVYEDPKGKEEIVRPNHILLLTGDITMIIRGDQNIPYPQAIIMKQFFGF